MLLHLEGSTSVGTNPDIEQEFTIDVVIQMHPYNIVSGSCGNDKILAVWEAFHSDPKLQVMTDVCLQQQNGIRI